MLSDTAVRAVNALTARWARSAATSGGTVFSAAGLWPLLAALADGAEGAARKELADAVGIPAEDAARHAHDLLTALGGLPGTAAAIGLWTRPDLAVSPDWTARLPAHVHQRIAEVDPQRHLDAWAARHTDGRIDRFPVTVDESTRLVLAGALAVRTEWIRRFFPATLWPATGPWSDRQLAALGRTTALLDRLGVADTAAGTVSELRVLGTGGIDVHLLLGEEPARPGDVLTAGIDLLHRRYPRVSGDVLPYGSPGPGVQVRREGSYEPESTLTVLTPGFTVAAHHQLLEDAACFGLATASDDSRGHFPGITPGFPLAVQSAAQSATATFGATGFRAAAVSAVAAAAGSAAWLPYVVRAVRFTVDRPFGFLAVHRTSRLVLTAGWVEQPDEPQDQWS
ncbi:serpin family protein [Kitasatospora sp. NPDC088346]|uniref:serpin family protein n=1 Tax=Kitasatospora sp. NPDC088346 TaxID=3364073 RepID=UPI0037FDCA46